MADDPGRDELRRQLRAEPAPAEAIVLVRGGPDTVSLLRSHAGRGRDRLRLDLSGRGTNPAVITPGAIVVAGTPDAPAVAEVVDLVAKPAGTVAHLRIPPGSVSDYAVAVVRATSAA